MDKLILFSSFVASIAAAPVAATGHGNVVRYGTGGGILGFLVYDSPPPQCAVCRRPVADMSKPLTQYSLLVDIYIFLELFKSSRPIERKFLWALLVFFFPGMLLATHLRASLTCDSGGILGILLAR